VLAVAIDDEPGEAIRFAPGEPAKLGIDLKTVPKGNRELETADEKFVVKFLLSA
jgi:hypothetical protein